MPSRFTVVDDPFEDARLYVGSAVQLGQDTVTMVSEGASEAALIGANATTHALRWVNENVEWQVRWICLLAALCLLSSVISRCCISHCLLRKHRRAWKTDSHPKTL